jgi:hypothetical protein
MADVRVAPEVQLKAQNGANFDLLNVPQGDAQANTGLLGIIPMGFDGTNYDRIRTTEGIAATPYVKSGILASAVVGWDGVQTQAATVRAVNGEMALITHDYRATRKLDELLIAMQELLEEGLGDAIIEVVNKDAQDYSVYSVISAATTNAVSITQQRSRIYGWYFFNTTASIKYAKFYDQKSTPTVGTDVPELRIPIPASSGANVEIRGGIDYRSGIGLAITGAVGDTDTTVTAVGDVVANVFYK